jgi:hypothetical protein
MGTLINLSGVQNIERQPMTPAVSGGFTQLNVTHIFINSNDKSVDVNIQGLGRVNLVQGAQFDSTTQLQNFIGKVQNLIINRYNLITGAR